MDTQFLAIQSKLSELKNDRTQYLSIHDVLALYKEFSSALEALSDSDTAKLKPIIHETLLIFSLAFITSGHTRETISIYAKIVTFHTLYEFITCETYITPKELGLLEASLINAQAGPDEVGDIDIPRVQYLDNAIKEYVRRICVFNTNTAERISMIPEVEYPLNSQVIHLRRDILWEVTKAKVDSKKLEFLRSKFQRMKVHIENIDWPLSKFTQFQVQKTELFLERFKDGVSESELKESNPDLIPIFQKLREILPELDVYIMTRRWTLRATDLYQYMRYLESIMPKLLVIGEQIKPMSENPLENDLMANYLIGDVTGAEFDVQLRENNPGKYLYLVTYMARRAWSQIYKLLECTEPVSEALSSYYNQLLTMKRCLNEVRLAGGVSNLRELYPYQMKLSSFDSSRKDGKFIVNGEVPPGQGVLNAILAECFDIVYELKVELEEKGECEEEDEELDDDVDDEDHNSEQYCSKSDICDSDSNDCDSAECVESENEDMRATTKTMPVIDDPSATFEI